MKHFVVCAFRHVGKTYLADRVIRETKRNIYGFSTRVFPELADKFDGMAPIYIFPAGAEPVFDDDHLIGLGGGANHYTNTEVFDSLGVELLDCNDPNGLIIMDEVGFLEMSAEKFQARILECLAGDIPCLVMLKMKLQFEFIKKLSTLEGTEFIIMNEDNRDQVYESIISRLG